MYNGVFGAHVALILRRLRRLAALYGASPRFCCCTATIGNPSEVFTQLTGIENPLVITRDGSPHGRHRLLLWNPPLVQPAAPIPPGKGVPALEPSAATGRDRCGAVGGVSGNVVVARHGWRSDEANDGRRQSSNIEAAVLFAELVRRGLKVICFCSVRKICELVLDYSRQVRRHLLTTAPHVCPNSRAGGPDHAAPSCGRRRV